MRNRFRVGEHLVTDDGTGRVYYSAEMVKQWDGLVVNKKDQEFRHPQEFVQVKPDAPPPTMVRYDSWGSAIDCPHTTSEVSIYRTGVSCSATDYTNLYLPRDWNDIQVSYQRQGGMGVSVSPTEGLVLTPMAVENVISTLMARNMPRSQMDYHYSPSLGRQFITYDDIPPDQFYSFKVAHDS